MLVAYREIDPLAAHPSAEPLFAPADYYKELTDLMDDDVIL